MEREILFRGKCVDNGEWVEGYLSKSRDENNLLKLCIDYEEKGVMCSSIVIPETIGQYTGLNDKNGRKIFEGDILEARYDDEYPDNVTIEVVKWIHNGWHTQQGDYPPDKMDDVETMPFSEVIGNVHDNPELMGEKNA